MKRRTFLHSLGVITAGMALSDCKRKGAPEMRDISSKSDNLRKSYEQLAKHRIPLSIERIKVHLVNINRPALKAPPDSPLSANPRPNLLDHWTDPDKSQWGSWGPFGAQAGMSIVEVQTQDGMRGFGLAGGGRPMQMIVEEHLAQVIRGRNPFDLHDTWDQMYAATIRYGRMGLTAMAISGIDLALWDIVGKVSGLPVYEFLGGKLRDGIPAYGTGTDVRWNVEQGLTAVKIPMPFGPRDGEEGKRRSVEFFEKARALIGPETRMMTDCLMGWDSLYTLEMAHRLRKVGLYWLEEPLLPHDYEGYAKLCQEIDDIRIASGEHEFTHHGFRQLIGQKAADILQPDIAWTGGLTALLHINHMAEQAGLPVFPHTGGTIWYLQFMAASANSPMAETFGVPREPNPSVLYNMIRPVPVDGHLRISDKPGFGLEITDALLDEYRRSDS